MLPKAGLVYQMFDFNAYDTEQVGYGPYAQSYTVNVSGKTLEYTVEYFFFYLGPEFRKAWQGVSLSAGIFFCPYVYVTDRDDHILRAKLSEAETEGIGYMTSFSAQWNNLRGFSINLSGHYLSLDTDGTQRQLFYAALTKDSPSR